MPTAPRAKPPRRARLKPVAALLIGLFVVHRAALGPLVVGVAVGGLVLRFLPTEASEHGGAAGTGAPPTALWPM